MQTKIFEYLNEMLLSLSDDPKDFGPCLRIFVYRLMKDKSHLLTGLVKECFESLVKLTQGHTGDTLELLNRIHEFRKYARQNKSPLNARQLAQLELFGHVLFDDTDAYDFVNNPNIAPRNLDMVFEDLISLYLDIFPADEECLILAIKEFTQE